MCFTAPQIARLTEHRARTLQVLGAIEQRERKLVDLTRIANELPDALSASALTLGRRFESTAPWFEQGYKAPSFAFFFPRRPPRPPP